MAQQRTLKFTLERETKNTVRYAEAGDPLDHTLGTVYVSKRTLRDHKTAAGAWPTALEVTLTFPQGGA